MAYAKAIRRMLLPGVLLCTASLKAFESQLTVQTLNEFCTSSASDLKSACRFYILGSFEGLQIGGTAEPDGSGHFKESKSKRFCMPEDMPNSKMVSEVLRAMKFDLQKFPEDRDLPAISFIAAVITKRFPCNK